MKRIKLQLAFATVFTICSFILVCLMFVYMIQYQGQLSDVHAIMGIGFALVYGLCFRLFTQVAQEYQEAKDEYTQHMLDMSNDYASREY